MKRHPFDPISLVGGVLFAALGIALLAGGIDLTAEGSRWIWPAGFIAFGLAVLATIRPQPDREVAAEPEDEPTSREDEPASPEG